MLLIIFVIILWIVLGNINKQKANISKLNKELEELNEKKQEKHELKERIRDLKREIREIDKEIDEGDLDVKGAYFQYLCERLADLQMELDDCEFELEWIDK